jgi:hypothetical protein
MRDDCPAGIGRRELKSDPLATAMSRVWFL